MSPSRKEPFKCFGDWGDKAAMSSWSGNPGGERKREIDTSEGDRKQERERERESTAILVGKEWSYLQSSVRERIYFHSSHYSGSFEHEESQRGPSLPAARLIRGDEPRTLCPVPATPSITAVHFLGPGHSPESETSPAVDKYLFNVTNDEGNALRAQRDCRKSQSHHPKQAIKWH